MMRELTPWALALTVVLSACGDEEPAPSECESANCIDDRDAGRRTDARADSAVRDAGKPDDEEGGEEEEPVVDAGAAPRDASPAKDAEAPKDAGAPDASRPPAGDGGLESLRQACLDTINMYRATKSLPPMARASAESESCSDDGAEFDSKANKAHGSSAKGAIPCRTSGVTQNTCPNWPTRGGSVEAAMNQCLAQMWAEGEPPGGVKACTDAYFQGDTACFLAHGHYINMISNNKFVSCGFYENEKKQWWMNQDFTAR
ncbi:MAG: hypothetical protein ABW352_00010 [Polyangiales bacterium]